MLELPSRAALANLARAASAVAPAAMVGLCRPLDEVRVSILYSYSNGIGAYDLPIRDVPEPLRPRADATLESTMAPAPTPDEGGIEWHLRVAGVQRVLSWPIPRVEPASRFWVGLTSSAPPSDAARQRLLSIAESCTELLATPPSPDATLVRLERLELTAGLLPTLLQALDVREIFDRLSVISRRALPHDLLSLGLFNDDLSSLSLYAQTGLGSGVESVVPHTYPPALTRAWDFDIIDERTAHAIEATRPHTHAGARSSLRLPIRMNNRVIGGLGFMSFQPAAYTTADVAVARRLVDYFSVALAHQRLAEEGRRAAALREREANLELLDELTAALVDTGDLHDVFGRLSATTRKVLPHDALVLPVVLPDRRHARLHSVSGLPAGSFPDVLEVPEAFVENPDWESEIIDDLSVREERHHARHFSMGFHSALRVPIRLDGRFAGTLILLSMTPAAYRQTDIMVARRIADRIALTLAREREREAARRADEAAARASKLETRVQALTDELDARTGYRRVLGESPEWRAVLTEATQVAPNETTVLLLGESGTGKEVVARFIHRASPRSKGPFVALNCAALPEQLLEAELFGYERGAYTGATQSKPGQLELAAGGTVLLDEVGEMSLSAQAKFLRVLQEREFQRLGGTRVLRSDVRVIAATNRDLPSAMARGLFREDLYYRLNVFAIRLPALRERPADILPLSEGLLADIGRGLGRTPGALAREARTMLQKYHWPGNVRELRNVLERAAILCEGGPITGEHLALRAPAPRMAAAARPADAAPDTPPPAPTASDTDLKSVERRLIEQALQKARFNRSKAAQALGLTRHQLYARIKKHGLE